MMILNGNYLSDGPTGTSGNLKYTFLTNETSIYAGMCIYTLNTGMQSETNRNLKEIMRKAYCEISFIFDKILDLDYYCTMFLSYGGELIVSLHFFQGEGYPGQIKKGEETLLVCAEIKFS